jgi:hypothetical protein
VGPSDIRDAPSGSDDVNADMVDGVDGVDILKRSPGASQDFGAIDMSWRAYQVNVFDDKVYRFGDVSITNSPSFPNQFFICLAVPEPPAYHAP